MDRPRTERRNHGFHFLEFATAVGAALMALLWVIATNAMDLSWGELARHAQTVWHGIFPPN